MVVLIAFSAYFSATETAFTALSRSRVKTMADAGNKRAARVLRLSEQYDKLVSTILIGNNIVNIALASIATILFVSWFPKNGAGISTAVTTVVVLIFGEITPKSLAKESPERFALLSAPLISLFIVILTPVNFLFSLWRSLVGKLFHTKDDRRMTENELLAIIDEAEEGGGLGDEESELIRSAIEFHDMTVESIAVPRVDVAGVDLEDFESEQVENLFEESGYSRLPAYEESMDRIIGVLHQKNFLEWQKKGGDLRTYLQTPVFIPEHTKISVALKLLQHAKCHMAVISDEYGGTFGIVTLEDILEELVGEIWDEHDEVIEEFQQVDENTYRILCSASLAELFERFSLNGETESSTVSGWVMDQLQKIPVKGDTFTYENLEVTVTETDNRRVQEILVKVHEVSDANEEEKEEAEADSAAKSE